MKRDLTQRLMENVAICGTISVGEVETHCRQTAQGKSFHYLLLRTPFGFPKWNGRSLKKSG